SPDRGIRHSAKCHRRDRRSGTPPCAAAAARPLPAQLHASRGGASLPNQRRRRARTLRPREWHVRRRPGSGAAAGGSTTQSRHRSASLLLLYAKEQAAEPKSPADCTPSNPRLLLLQSEKQCLVILAVVGILRR